MKTLTLTDDEINTMMSALDTQIDHDYEILEDKANMEDQDIFDYEEQIFLAEELIKKLTKQYD